MTKSEALLFLVALVITDIFIIVKGQIANCVIDFGRTVDGCVRCMRVMNQIDAVFLAVQCSFRSKLQKKSN